MSAFHDLNLRALDGPDLPLAPYKGQIVLVVNVASKCGLTPQYEGLEKLYREKKAAGLEVLGFPANNFNGQEPGSEDEIRQFCSLTYDVTFPMFAKIDVNGSGADPLFKWLRSAKGGVLGDAIKWNFTKFLIGRDGQVLKRYAPTVEPTKIRADIVDALAA